MIIMTDYDQKKYVAVYDQFKVNATLLVALNSGIKFLTLDKRRLVQETVMCLQLGDSTTLSPPLATAWPTMMG